MLTIVFVATLSAVFVTSGLYWLLIAAAACFAVVGILGYYEASWCLRRYWDLAEKAIEEADSPTKAIVELAAQVCKDNEQNLRQWAVVLFVGSGGMLALAQL
jgi:hypothetical protein